MVSSVSSEQAFSLAGITINKCHSQLKGDIVEVLQFLKCLICCGLVFHANQMEPLDSDIGKEADIIMHGRNSLVLDMNQFTSWDELQLEEEEAITEG